MRFKATTSCGHHDVWSRAPLCRVWILPVSPGAVPNCENCAVAHTHPHAHAHDAARPVGRAKWSSTGRRSVHSACLLQGLERGQCDNR